jgi:hypothetical protein
MVGIGVQQGDTTTWDCPAGLSCRVILGRTMIHFFYLPHRRPQPLLARQVPSGASPGDEDLNRFRVARMPSNGVARNGFGMCFVGPSGSPLCAPLVVVFGALS